MNVSILKYTLLGITLALTLTANAQENSQRKNIRVHDGPIRVINDTVVDDEDTLQFIEGIVSMKGYTKMVGASKESFMLVNNSNLHLSGLEIKFKYVDLDGVLIHERVATIDCDLPPHKSRQVSIKTFDEGHQFYYYRHKSKKDAIAYDLTIRIESYNIKVTRKK